MQNKEWANIAAADDNGSDDNHRYRILFVGVDFYSSIYGSLLYFP